MKSSQHLLQDGEGLGVKDIDIAILRGHNQTTNSVVLCMALLESCHGGDDRLPPEGEESKGCQERLLQLWIVLQLQVLERSDTQWNLLLPLSEVQREREDVVEEMMIMSHLLNLSQGLVQLGSS